MTADDKPREKIALSFSQATWGVSMVIGLISLIVVVLGTWYDMRTQLAVAVALFDRRLLALEAAANSTYTQREIDIVQRQNEAKTSALDDRIDRLESWKRTIP